MKFAHLADCHVGAWREPRMSALADQALSEAFRRAREENVDFVLIAGDLFNTALPGIDHIKHVTKEFHKMKESGIPIYIIAGSHDYSPTGKTMLDVLEEAGLCKNVFKIKDNQLQLTTDPGTGVKIAGIVGRAGQLDKELYETLELKQLEKEQGKKIFMFHTTIEELKPKDMAMVEGQEVSFMPRGFDYYAGGHVHIVDSVTLPGYADVVYPGPLFPAEFSELEKLGGGGFYIVEDRGGKFVKRRVDVIIKKTLPVKLDCNGMTPEEVKNRLEKLTMDCEDRIVLIRLTGKLGGGSATDIDFRGLFEDLENRGAYHCMKNTSALVAEEIEETSTEHTAEEAEAEAIKEHLGKVQVGMSEEEEEKLFHALLTALSRPQAEGELKTQYQERVLEEALELLER